MNQKSNSNMILNSTYDYLNGLNNNTNQMYSLITNDIEMNSNSIRNSAASSNGTTSSSIISTNNNSNQSRQSPLIQTPQSQKLKKK